MKHTSEGRCRLLRERAEGRSLDTEAFGCFKWKICLRRVAQDNRPTAEDTRGQSCACEHWHTFLLRGDNVRGISAIPYNSLLCNNSCQLSEFASHSRGSVIVKWDGHLLFQYQGFLEKHLPSLSTFCPSLSAGWETYSLKRRLWILVMAFEAMGLPMPELAGEPWETGVML